MPELLLFAAIGLMVVTIAGVFAAIRPIRSPDTKVPRPRRVLVCDACGDRVVGPDPLYTDTILTFDRLQRMAVGYFG